MKRLLAIMLGLSIAGFMLTACNPEEPSKPYVVYVKVGERTIPCIWLDGYNSAGMSCDWSK